MQFAKSGQICNFCQPNALLTLKEYQQDYASEETKKAIQKVWDTEVKRIQNPKVYEKTLSLVHEIENGKRDFRF